MAVLVRLACSTDWSRSTGAPCSARTSPTSATVWAPTLAAAGWLTIRALRALTQIRILNTRVATGLVMGMSPSTTPTGLAISVTRGRRVGGADPWPALQGPVDLEAGEAVLEGLVGDVADPGLGHGGRGQLLGQAGHRLGDGVQQRLDLGLGPAGKHRLGGHRLGHGRVDGRVDVGREHVLLQMAAGLPGLGGGVAAQRPQHGQPGRRVVAAQPAEGGLGQDEGGDLGVGVGAGRSGLPSSRLNSPQSMPGPRWAMTPSESKSGRSTSRRTSPEVIR